MLLGLNLAIIVGVFLHTAVHSPGEMILAWAECVLFLPLVLVVHEAGHMLVARLLGMDVGSVVVGVGPRLWESEIGGIPFRVNLVPLFGHVSIGLPTEAFARLRLWFAVLAGPAANLGAMWLSAHYWTATSRLLGGSGTMLWVFTNGLIGVANLLPFRVSRQGLSARSDGLGLIQIPWEPRAKLRLYLANASIARALHRYRRGDYSGARSDCLLALSRDPSSDAARCLLSSCLARRGLFDESREVVASVLDGGSVPGILAWAKDNVATAIVMDDDAQSASLADRLSREAYDAFPCLLTFRTDRALVLTWMGDPGSALSILDYVHFKSATRPERAEHAGAEALALRVLGRVEDANRRMATAQTLKAVQFDVLERVILASMARRAELPIP